MVNQCTWNTQVCITWNNIVQNDAIQNIALLINNNQYQIYVSFQSSAIFCLNDSLQQNDKLNLLDFIPNWPRNANKYCSQIQVYNEQQILFCYIQTSKQFLFEIYKIQSLFQTQIFVLFGNYIQVLNPQIQQINSSNQIIASFAAIFQKVQNQNYQSNVIDQSDAFEIKRINFVDNQIQYNSYNTQMSQSQFKNLFYLYIQSKQIYYSSNDNGKLFFTNANQIISQEILQQNKGGSLPISNNTQLIHSDQMNKIITLGNQVNIINLNSFFLETVIPTQQIQNTYFNNYSLDDQSNTKILIAYSDTQMALVNITDEQITVQQLFQINQIKKMYVSVSQQIIYILEKKLCKISIPIISNNIQPIEIYSKQLDDCFLNSQIFVCFFNVYLYIFTSEQIKSGQLNPIVVITSMSNIQYEVDLINQVIYLIGNNILRFLDFKGQKLAQDIQGIINYGNLKFYYISDYLIVSTSKSMNIISRLTLTLMNTVQYQNVQTITSILFIESQLQIAVSYMESTNGQIYYYSLESFQIVGQSYYSYSNNNNYYVSDAFYDSLNDRYFTINMNGLLIEWDTSSKIIKQLYQIQELFQNTPQQGDFIKMKFLKIMNKILVYNQKRIFFVEYNNLIQNQVEGISFFKYFYQCYLNTTNNQICYFVDSNNNFYSYQNSQKQYIGQFSNQVMQFLCLNSCQTAFIIQKSQIQIFQNYFKSSTIQQNINFFQVIPTDLILFQLRIQDIQGTQYIYNTTTQNFTADSLMQNKQERVIVSTIANSYLYMGCQDGQVYGLNSSIVSSFQIQNINTKGQMIKIIAISSKQLLIIHNTGYVTFIMLPDLTEQITDVKNVFNYLYSINPIEQVNIAEWDSLYQRIFINQIGKSTLFILEKEVHLMLTSRSLPSQFQNKLRFSKNYIILYSQNQINIYNRIDLILFDIIRKQINVYNIIEINTVYSDTQDVILVFYINSIEIYYLNSITKSAVLIAQTQNNLKYPQLLNSYIKQNILYLSFFSQSNVYDLQADINSYNDKYCIGIFNYNSDFQSDKNILNYQNIAQQQTQSQIQINYQNIQIKQQTQIYNLLLPNQTFRFYSQYQFNVAFYPQSIANNYLNITQQTFGQQQYHQNPQFFSNFSLSDFNLQFIEDSSSVQFPQNVQNVFLNNITISQNNKISDNKFYFSNMNSLIISFLTLDSLQFDQKVDNSFFNIFNISTVSIQNLIIKNCQIRSIYSIFSIQQVKNLNIDTVNVVQSQITRIFFISQIFNSTLTNISIINCFKLLTLQGQLRYFFEKDRRKLEETITQENEITLIPTISISTMLIQGCVNIQLKNIVFQNNQNLQFLTYQKQVENNDFVQYQKQNQIINLYNFTITNNTFSQQDTNRYNYIIYISTDTVKLDTIHYYLNQANIQLINTTDFQMVNSVFIRNSCISGCAIYLYNTKNQISIKTSIFQNNIAKANGGAILANYFNQIEIDRNSVISENKALIGGGMRLLNDQSGSQLNYSNLFIRVVFSNQATIFGNNVATYLTDIFAFKIETDKIHEQSKISIQNSLNLLKSIDQNNQQIVKDKYIQILQLQSGGKFSFGIQLVDNEGVKWNFDQINFLNNLYPSEIVTEIQNYSFELIQGDQAVLINGRALTNINSYNSTERAIVFSQIIISQHPNAHAQLYFKYNINQQIGQQLILVDIKFRQCIQGEIYQQLPSNITTCYVCPQGTYSLQKFDDQFLASPQNCLPCPQGALACDSNKIQLLDGFWKSQSDISDNILECKNKPFACKSQDPNSKYGCIEGYIGPLCESCDVDGLVWSQNKSVEDTNSSNIQNIFVQRRYRSVPQLNQCRECGSLQSNLIYFFVLLSSLIVITYLLLLTIIKTFTHYCKATYIRLMEILPVSSSCFRDNVPFHIKIILNFLQISVLAVNLNESVGNRIKTSISIVGETTSQLTYSFSCIYPSQWNNNAGYAGILGIQNTVLPFFYIAAVYMLIQFISFIVYIPQAKNKSKYFSSYTNPHATIISIQLLLYYLQPTAVHFLLSSMRCRNISGTDYINFYPATPCNDEKFQKIFNLFFIPSLIFWLGAPLIFSLFLVKRRKSLQSTRTVLKYGFLYLEYKNQFYLWEFVRIYMKTIIVIINGYFIYSDQQSLSKIIITIILVIYISAKLIYQPFQNKNLSNFDTISNFMLALIVFLQYLYEDYAQKSQNLSQVITILYCSYIILMIAIASLSKFFFSIHMFSHFLHQKVLQKILPFKIYRYIFKHRQIIKFKICQKWMLIQRNINFIIATQAMNNFQNINTLDKVNIFNLKARQFLEDNIKVLYDNEQNQKAQKEATVLPKKGDALGLSISIQESDYQVNQQAQNAQQQDHTFAVEKIIEKKRAEFEIDQKQNFEQQSYTNDQYQLNQMPVTQNVSINNSFLNNYTPISNKNKQQLSNSSIQIFQDSVKNIQANNKKDDQNNHTPLLPQQTPEQENLNFSSHPNIISLDEIKIAIDKNQKNPKGQQKPNLRVNNVQEINRVSSFNNSNQRINFTLQTEKDIHDRHDDKTKVNEEASLIQFD
ncbi:transmembrane protein, putative (macronuclear) [Tetrahymena thermophila SB210]|uniref:Transmembrane protein, putative n=1 Tax=Tetrahymena thermophila (strain SB210) TaxID=312017 RepID=I7MDL4_TETTS|nr:transmembrane protein, putative [Tetrahymena thermophila SB210]EAR89351.2 transmembrane protein, putative [Tetrahymena thermophila SB210]|eukprot:XP_001009596.2 transmembrane protein, putative [Tetrahymena thermophila SB210]